MITWNLTHRDSTQNVLEKTQLLPKRKRERERENEPAEWNETEKNLCEIYIRHAYLNTHHLFSGDFISCCSDNNFIGWCNVHSLTHTALCPSHSLVFSFHMRKTYFQAPGFGLHNWQCVSRIFIHFSCPLCHFFGSTCNVPWKYGGFPKFCCVSVILYC